MINIVEVTNEIKKKEWHKIPSHRVNSVKIKFEFSKEWEDLICVALFIQDGKCIPQVIDENNECLLPIEIVKGMAQLSVFGNKTDGSAYRETAIKLEFDVYDSGYCEDMTPPIPPTPDLYEQLLERFKNMITVDVDQIYNALSENAQSGTAVAQAVKGGVETANKYTDEKIADIPKPTLDHKQLINRDAPDQHTIGSITGLQAELDKGVKIYSGTELDVSPNFGKIVVWNWFGNKFPYSKMKVGDFYLNTKYDELYRITFWEWDGSDVTGGRLDYERVCDEPSVVDYVTQEIAKMPQPDVDKAYVDDIKSNLDDEINLLTGEVSDVKIDVGKPIHTTLNVEIEDDGFGGYRADYNDNDINNHRNAGGIVQAKYYNQAENQTYTYYYSTMESDRKPTFIRTFINADGKAEQVLVSIGNDKKVTVERRISSGGGVSQEYVEQNFASIVKDSQSGNYLFINDLSPYKQKITVNSNQPKIKVCGKNLFKYPYENTTKTVNGITFTDNGDGSITVNGTASADAYFSVAPKPFVPTKTRAMTFMSGCPQGGGKESYFLAQINYGFADYGEGVLIRGVNEYRGFKITIKQGYTANNLVFKPMLSYDLIDHTYEKPMNWKEFDVVNGKAEISTAEYSKHITIDTDLPNGNKSAELSAEWNADTKQWLLNELNKRTASTQALTLGV